MMNDKKIEIEIESDDEGVTYPPADRQFPSNRKYMTYDSIQTGAPGKKA
jgi:hypothetical protein